MDVPLSDALIISKAIRAGEIHCGGQDAYALARHILDLTAKIARLIEAGDALRVQLDDWANPDDLDVMAAIEAWGEAKGDVTG